MILIIQYYPPNMPRMRYSYFIGNKYLMINCLTMQIKKKTKSYI